MARTKETEKKRVRKLQVPLKPKPRRRSRYVKTIQRLRRIQQEQPQLLTHAGFARLLDSALAEIDNGGSHIEDHARNMLHEYCTQWLLRLLWKAAALVSARKASTLTINDIRGVKVMEQGLECPYGFFRTLQCNTENQELFTQITS